MSNKQSSRKVRRTGDIPPLGREPDTRSSKTLDRLKHQIL